MIDINLLMNEETREQTIQALEKRGPYREKCMELIKLETERRAMLKVQEVFRARKNAVNEIMKKVKPEDRKEVLELIDKL